MHLTDGANHNAGQFEDRDLITPTPGTQLEKHWLNMVQGELKALLDDAGVTPVKGTWTQVRDSLRSLFVRATGTATQTITGLKTFTSKLTINTSAESLDVDGGGSNPTADIANTGSGPAVKATVADPSKPSVQLSGPAGAGGFARFGVFSTDGSFPSAPSPGDTVYLGGSNNKLYTWDGSAWNAHW